MEGEADALNDTGHIALITDLKHLFEEAEKGKFHDFHRNGADAPKMALVELLKVLKDATINGKYDN